METQEVTLSVTVPTATFNRMTMVISKLPFDQVGGLMAEIQANVTENKGPAPSPALADTGAGAA